MLFLGIFLLILFLKFIRSQNKTSNFVKLNPDDTDFETVELNEQQKKLFDKINASNKHILVTGKAGTGKSLLLRYLKENSSKKLVVVAPTGVAALNIRGQTIHSLFKIPPSFRINETVKIDDKTATLLKNIDAIVIDEISMVRADLIDVIDRILKHTRSNDTPFGGVQIIMFGDLYQLPPVIEDPELYKYFALHHGGYYFFNAHVWRDVQPKIYELKTVFRQKNEEFKTILNAIRIGKVSEEIFSKLNTRVKDNFPQDNVITLATANSTVNETNDIRLDSLKGKLYQYSAIISGKLETNSLPTNETLSLKKGAQVMLLKNDRMKRWVNGTIGYIHSLKRNEIKVDIDGIIYSIPQETWSKIRYSFDPEKNIIEEEIVSSFTQFPIKLAWAITIHKSQGQTYGSVIVDMGSGAFAHGQTYVALSRCRNLEGLYLKRKITQKDIIVDPAVINFMNKKSH